MNISIVLVSPKGAANVGGVARLMANFGYEDLRIIEPRCDLSGDEARMMSLRAYPIIESAKIFTELSAAIEDKNFVLGFSAIEVGAQRPVISLNDLPREADLNNSEQTSLALVFGREDHGLHKEELRLCDRHVVIPTAEAYESLNLSSAVAIVLSQIFGLLSSDKARSFIRSEADPLPRKLDEEIFFEGLQAMLEHIGFLNLKTSKHLLLDLRDMYHRSNIRSRELRILFGIVADLEHKLNKKFFCS